MYWNPHSASSIDNLLDKHDTTLETLLSIDNIILQVKNGEKRLIAFLGQPDHLMKLFSYSVATDLPEDKAISYPYVACGIICGDGGKFVEMMRRNNNIITPLWSFLTDMKPRHFSNQAVNPSVTGDSPSAIQNAAVFFSRLNIFLLNKMLPTMLTFMEERIPNALELLINNLDLQPIAELLYRFYALPASNVSPTLSTSSLNEEFNSASSNNSQIDVLEWLEKNDFYAILADHLRPSYGPDLHYSVSQFISGLFALPFPDNFDRRQVLQPFIRRSWLNSLLSGIFATEPDQDPDEFEENFQSALMQGIEVISSILSSVREYNENQREDLIEISHFIEEILQNYSTFIDLLRHPPSLMGVGSFGRIRIRIVRMFTEIISLIPFLSSSEDQLRVIEFVEVRQLCPQLVGFFFEFEGNNFLHLAIVRLIQEIFGREQGRLLGRLSRQLLASASSGNTAASAAFDLRGRIVRAQRENDARCERPHQNRLPFMGHLVLLAEAVINWEEQESSSITDVEWREFVEKSFRETKARDSQVLGGIRPQQPLEEAVSSIDSNFVMFGGSTTTEGKPHEEGKDEEGEDFFLDYNAVFRSGDEEQLARYFCQQIIGNIPAHFLYNSMVDIDEEDEKDDEEYDDEDVEVDEEALLHVSDFDVVISTTTSTRSSSSSKSRGKSSVASIEIPVLLGNDDFDDDLYESSFTTFGSFDTNSEDSDFGSDESEED